MNLISQINNILKEFETGDKLNSYKKLKRVFNNNKDNNLLRYNLAVIAQKLNFNEEARINYNYLIKTENNLKAMINLYNIDIIEGKYQQALNTIDKILRIEKIENVEKDKAFIFHKLNRIEESKKICINYLKKNNKDLTALNIIGQCFFSEKIYDEAIKVFENILQVNSKNLSALNSLGRIYHEKREPKKAEMYFFRALEVDSLSFYILNNIAGFYREELNYDKAIYYYNKALSVNPNNAYIYNNLSKIYFDLNNHQDAKKNSMKALEMKGDDGDILKTLSFIYLKDHEFKKGWEYFEGRLNLDNSLYKSDYVQKLNKKLYKSNIINNKKDKFLIVREQGIGDEILYSSMYGELLEDVENAVIECDARLLSLFKRSFPKYSKKFVALGNITNDDEKYNQIDYVLYAGSLGRYYRKDYNDFKKGSFLRIDEKKFKNIQTELTKFKKKYKIGISWKSFNNRYAIDKSLSLKDFSNIFNLNYCDVINLQYGDVNEEIKNFNNNTNNKLLCIKDLDLNNDFEGIASLLKSLDIFITISNSTAHLAGSLGVKTILIKPENYALFHYWNQKKNRTPWYESVELIEKNNFLKNEKLLTNYLNK
ncbi:tetratricopeptide repeat protein [Pelagibacteraceae bacterium]|nr:tetratricopeptide repeat protein [Pelagibacteraceae bacterium]